MALNQKPSVFEYLDLNAFLQSYYNFRKQMDSEFSYESWANELGVKNKSFLRLAIVGKKKISQMLMTALSEKIFESKNEQEYFYYLVKYAYAPTQKDKTDFSNKLIRLIKGNSKEEVIEATAELLSSPWFMRMLTLLTFKDITPTVATFSKLIDKPAAEVEHLLLKLQELKLAYSVQVDGQTHWLCSGKAFKVPDQIGSEAIIQYHKASLDDAINAFNRPKDQRRYRSLLLPMSEEQMKEFYTLMDEFANEQKIRFNSESLKGKNLFQANFNIHRITETAT